MKNVLVQKSDRGEISLFDARDDFMASYKDGNWTGDSIFQIIELENFTIIEDDKEIIQILDEARSSLGKPFTK